MKKSISIISAITLVITSVIYTGCKKDNPDTAAPTITLNGRQVCYLQKNRQYVDADATAYDGVDGTLKVTSSGNVSIGVIGTYPITYTAKDYSGNVGTATRTVYVVDLEGTYTNAVNVKPFPMVVPSDTTRYNDALFLSVDLGGQLNYLVFGNNNLAYVASYLSDATHLDIPQQTVTSGNPSIPRTFVGSGTISNVNAPHTKITINYTEVSDTTYHGRIVYYKD